MVARAHPESDSATDAGINRCPQGVSKISQIRSVGSWNVPNGEGKCVVARAHPESDSATDAGINRCPQGVSKMS